MSMTRLVPMLIMTTRRAVREARGTLSDGALAFLAASRTVAPQHMGTVPAGVRVLRELENAHRALITMHLEKTLKSDRVIRDLRRHG
mgnify:CR=1 FL=1